jgi:hypothetical protein
MGCTRPRKTSKSGEGGKKDKEKKKKNNGI